MHIKMLYFDVENLLVLVNIWGSDRDSTPHSCCVNCNFCRDFPFIHNSGILALVFYNIYISDCQK